MVFQIRGTDRFLIHSHTHICLSKSNFLLLGSEADGSFLWCVSFVGGRVLAPSSDGLEMDMKHKTTGFHTLFLGTASVPSV